jgi:O-methyltransferase
MTDKRGFQLTSLVNKAVQRLPNRQRDSVVRQLLWARHVLELGADEEEADRHRFFRAAFYALAFNGIGGDYVEFGSWTGRSFRLAYDASRRAGYLCRLWSFDSFAGLPAPQGTVDEHPKWTSGTMATPLQEFEAILRRHGIPADAYRIVPGWYDATLGPDARGERPHDISLAYVDCDLYSSTRTVLEFLLPRLKHGMIIAMDDYFAYSATDVSGERRATCDFLANHERFRLVPFLRYGWASVAFTVEDRSLLLSPHAEDPLPA